MRAAIAGTILAAWLCTPAHAQPAAAGGKLEFEVASIKPSAIPGRGAIRPGRQGGPGTGAPGRATYAFSTIRDLIVDAYGVKPSQISGGPGWLDSERFDLVAKVPEGATKDQVRIMLQNFLAERFQLTLHRETKELSVYALVVGAKGPKLKDATALPADDSQSREAGGPPGPGRSGMKVGPDGCPEVPRAATGRSGSFVMMTPSGECMISRGQTMESLAAQLSDRFDRPVIDQTGLPGKYEVRLRYDPSSMPGGRGDPSLTKGDAGPGPAGDAPGRMSAEREPPPSIFSALQEQLGLRLESRKGPVEHLVIDHVEKRPTGN